MVLPDNILEAVNEGDVSAVVAWLDAGGDVNDTVVGHSEHFIEGDTMLMAVAEAFISQEQTSGLRLGCAPTCSRMAPLLKGTTLIFLGVACFSIMQ